jgi:hypothetical protein
MALGGPFARLRNRLNLNRLFARLYGSIGEEFILCGINPTATT